MNPKLGTTPITRIVAVIILTKLSPAVAFGIGLVAAILFVNISYWVGMFNVAGPNTHYVVFFVGLLFGAGVWFYIAYVLYRKFYDETFESEEKDDDSNDKSRKEGAKSNVTEDSPIASADAEQDESEGLVSTPGFVVDDEDFADHEICRREELHDHSHPVATTGDLFDESNHGSISEASDSTKNATGYAYGDLPDAYFDSLAESDIGEDRQDEPTFM